MRILTLLTLAILSNVGQLFAQIGPISGGGVQYVTADPSGACTANSPLRYNGTNGKLWGCNAGTWAAISGGGGGSPTGAAGGGLTGTYPNPGLLRITAGAGTFTGPAVSGTVSQAPGANGIPQLDASGNLTIGNTVLGPVGGFYSVLPAVDASGYVPVLAGSGAGNVDNGVHHYKFTQTDVYGETNVGASTPSVTVVDKSTNGQVNVPTPPFCNEASPNINIYRDANDGVYKFVDSDNFPCGFAYTDNKSNASLGAVAPSVNTTLGFRFGVSGNSLTGWIPPDWEYPFISLGLQGGTGFTFNGAPGTPAQPNGTVVKLEGGDAALDGKAGDVTQQGGAAFGNGDPGNAFIAPGVHSGSGGNGHVFITGFTGPGPGTNVNLIDCSGSDCTFPQVGGTVVFLSNIDATGANSTKPMQVKAGPVPTANGALAFNTSTNNIEAGQSSGTVVLPTVSGTITNGDCLKGVVTSGKVQIGDAGAACVDILDSNKIPGGVRGSENYKPASIAAGATFTLLNIPNCAPSSASGTAYACTPSPALTSYTQAQPGVRVGFTPDVNGSGGSTTINVNGLGSVAVKESDCATNPTSTDIVAHTTYMLAHNGTVFCLQPGGGLVETLLLYLHNTVAIDQATTLNITYDGAGSPQISLPVSQFFGTRYLGLSANIPAFANRRMIAASDNSAAVSYATFLPMPFNSSIVIQLVNNGGTTTNIATTATHRVGIPDTWVRSQHLMAVSATNTNLTANSLLTLINVTTTAPSRLAGLYFSEDETPNSVTCPVLKGCTLEGKWNFYIDGSTSPSLTTDGTESLFLMSGYFTGFGGPGAGSAGTQWWAVPQGMNPDVNTSFVSQATGTYEAFRWFQGDRFDFDTGLKITVPCGMTSVANFTGNCSMTSTVYYYTGN